MKLKGCGQIIDRALVISLEDAHHGPCSEWCWVGWPRRNDVVYGTQTSTLSQLAAWDLLVKEVDIFGISIVGVALKHKRSDFLEG